MKGECFGLFRPNKNNGSFAEEKESGHGALDFSPDEMGRDFVSGLSDPDTAPGEGGSGDKVKKVLMFGVPLLLVSIGLVVYLGWDLVKEFGGGSRTVNETAKQTLGVTDAEYTKIMAQLQDRDRRLSLLEEERVKRESELDAKIREAVAAVAMSEAEKKRMEETAGLLRDVTASQSAMLDSIRLLEERLRAKLEEAPEYPAQPPKGSTATSSLYSALPQWNERIAQTEAAMAERASAAPPYRVERGVKTGGFASGVLRTSLISSTHVADLKAVVETTSPIEVSDGAFIPVGAVFIGTAKSDIENTRRMHLDLTEMRVGDVVIPVKAIALQNGNPGLVSKYIDPLNSAAWSMLLPNLIAGAASAAQDMTEKTNRYGETYQEPEFSGKNVALGGVAKTMQLQSQIMYEVQARKKPVIIVHRNIPVEIQFVSPIPFELLLEAGALDGLKRGSSWN